MLTKLFWMDQQTPASNVVNPSPPTNPPGLTPEKCFIQRELEAFFRTSRGLDDNVFQALSNMDASRRKTTFEYSQGSINPPRDPLSRVDGSTCAEFVRDMLFPNWRNRDATLNFCANVAASPDPNDPETALRAADMEKNQREIMNKRLDPYSGREQVRPSRTERLAVWIDRQRKVEDIIRDRTWDVIRTRCGNNINSSTWQGIYKESPKSQE